MDTNSGTSTKMAEDVVIRESQVFVEPEFTNGEPTLCDVEVAFFKEHGFLVKRGFLDEATVQRVAFLRRVARQVESDAVLLRREQEHARKQDVDPDSSAPTG